MMPCGSRALIVNANLKSSSLYRDFKTLHLTKNVRLAKIGEEPLATENVRQFPSFILKFGKGKVEDTVDRRIKLPSSIKIEPSVR